MKIMWCPVCGDTCEIPEFREWVMCSMLKHPGTYPPHLIEISASVRDQYEGKTLDQIWGDAWRSVHNMISY